MVIITNKMYIKPILIIILFVNCLCLISLFHNMKKSRLFSFLFQKKPKKTKNTKKTGCCVISKKTQWRFLIPIPNLKPIPFRFHQEPRLFATRFHNQDRPLPPLNHSRHLFSFRFYIYLFPTFATIQAFLQSSRFDPSNRHNVQSQLMLKKMNGIF